MRNIRNTPQWRHGDEAQQRWANILLELGNVVIPIFGFQGNVTTTDAPMIAGPSGFLAAPDIFAMSERMKRGCWYDVKAKTVPTWRRTHNRWEHGCDYSIAQEYLRCEAESGHPVILVVQETLTPTDLTTCSELEPSEHWLWIRITEAFATGEHREDWPGGRNNPSRRGRDGRGGLLWPRSAMTEFQMHVDLRAA